MKGNPLQKRIGKVIRARRSALGYSQEAFAERVDMHRAYYGAVERGEKNVQLSTLQRLCDALQVALWEVVRDAEKSE